MCTVRPSGALAITKAVAAEEPAWVGSPANSADAWAPEADASVVPERSRRTASLIKGAEFKTVPRAGHSSTMEEPEAVSALLRAFIDGVSTRAS